MLIPMGFVKHYWKPMPTLKAIVSDWLKLKATPIPKVMLKLKD
jgi:hypothetical protein